MSEPEELLELLGKEIEILQRKTAALDEMVCCVCGGDFDRLEDLLREEAAAGGKSAALERRMRKLCSRIGAARGLPPGQASLARLVAVLDGPEAIALQDRRERLLLAVQQVKEKSSATAFLVRRTMEINSRLLGALFDQVDGGQTYSPEGGKACGRSEATFEQTV